MEENKKKINKTRKSNGYRVTNDYLLYKISDAGLLHLYLQGVGRNKTNSAKRIFYFDRVPDIQEIIEQFKKDEGDGVENEHIKQNEPVQQEKV